ncbi:hypothetical protein ABT56_10990 [Photobacterium aquae]|uniref:Lipoprotein n=1 Tax=Photobacterium aquae TaxID=1195763 RepID=A0A0J1H119_9GAMM|nr:hypothetical protein [Photobacterium aquae]KLV05494.1 hypothetical protein ABT56_10990 [Photobacterium aquae]
MLFLMLVLFSSFSLSAELITKNVLNGRVSLLIPQQFTQMPDDILEIKYPSSRRPTEVLSDDSGSISLAFNHTNTVMESSDIPEFHHAISKMFHNLYPSAKWFRDEIIERNGRIFIVLELITPAMDTEIHNIMYGTSVDGRLLFIAFNTTIEQSKKWLPIGRKVMESLTIK